MREGRSRKAHLAAVDGRSVGGAEVRDPDPAPHRLDLAVDPRDSGHRHHHVHLGPAPSPNHLRMTPCPPSSSRRPVPFREEGGFPVPPPPPPPPPCCSGKGRHLRLSRELDCPGALQDVCDVLARLPASPKERPDCEAGGPAFVLVGSRGVS